MLLKNKSRIKENGVLTRIGSTKSGNGKLLLVNHYPLKICYTLSRSQRDEFSGKTQNDCLKTYSSTSGY